MWEVAMDREAQKHLGRVITSFGDKVTKKYMEGNKKNKGNLLKMDVKRLLLEIQQEALDSYVYIDRALELMETSNAVEVD